MSKKSQRLPSPQLEVRDLRVVVAIGRAGTTAAASTILHLSQSAVSRALAVAEDHARVELFERTKHGLIPTDAGRVVLEFAPTYLLELEAMERRLTDRQTPTRIRLASDCHMAYQWLSRLILHLRSALPNVRIEIPVEYSGQSIDALQNGKLDIALTTRPLPKGLHSCSLFEDELVFFISNEHPLATQPYLKPSDLTKYTLLVPNRRMEDLWFMKRVFGTKRPHLKVERFPITEAIVELSRAGEGIGVLSEWVAHRYLHEPDANLRVMKLKKGPLIRKWTMAYRPELKPMVPTLVTALQSAKPVVNL